MTYRWALVGSDSEQWTVRDTWDDDRIVAVFTQKNDAVILIHQLIQDALQNAR